MALTQKQLAEQLGVSQITVSRALHNSPKVREPLRQRIQASAAKNGYTLEGNFEARALRMRAVNGRTETRVVCIIVGGGFHLDEREYHARILTGLRRGCAEADYESVIADRYKDGEMPLVVQRSHVDGVIRLLCDEDLEHGLQQCNVPMVSVLRDAPEADVVRIDDVAAARTVGERLTALGHRCAAYIGPDNELARDRLSGLRTGLAGSVPERFVWQRSRLSGGAPLAEGLAELLAANGAASPADRFTALFVYNDHMAVQAVKFLSVQGVDVPGQLSVVGFDGALPRDCEGVSLATVAVPLEDIGFEAVHLLTWRLQHPDAPRRVLHLAPRWLAGTTLGSAPPG